MIKRLVSRGLKEKEAKKRKTSRSRTIKTDAADRVKSVTRKGTQSEEIEERRAKKEKEVKKKEEKQAEVERLKLMLPTE
jgi:hypothetical protein